ncbi:MAG: winged helix-turn-helix transcriptional regulator [Candidatus Thorarchaeota archaeon]|nr:winged helix-turn-helix transcriptional regulator [Candidatus Thorarchaeota archaeon]
MDSVDKNILLALDSNCRLSYQAIAESLGMTANAVRKRVERLIDTGVIEEFTVAFKPAMMNSDYLVALIHTDGSEDEEEFIQISGSNPNIIQVGQIVTSIGRTYLVHCEYIGAEGLKNLSTFLRTLASVKDVELHTIVLLKGETFEIKNLHLRVLKQLLKDARMQVTEISERTGLTARRVSRIIQELLESHAFWFAARWNLSQGENAEFYLKIIYNEQECNRDEIDGFLRAEFAGEYWYSYFSAMEPILFAKFVTKHFRDAELISSRIKNECFTKSIDILLSFPVKKFPRLGRIRLEKMISEANL